MTRPQQEAGIAADKPTRKADVDHHSPLDIYVIAIGGTGMAPMACLLQDLGHRLRGSDRPLYPPMSTVLEEAGITPLVGFETEHLTAEPHPDVVVVGNAVPRNNVEAQTMERLGIERLSMPEAISRFLLSGRRPLVIAGTHGKTTTSSMAAWVYESCDQDPGYLIGGVPRNLTTSFCVGSGPRFVIEGDEYNAAYFDRGPKFLHYQPQTLILTSVEHDHVDLYPEHSVLLDAYRQLVALVPEDGHVIACGDSPLMRSVTASSRCPVTFYGLGADNDVRPETAGIDLAVPGDHNVLNALAVWTTARIDGLDPARTTAALNAFEGVKRRLEHVGNFGGVTLIDDFAHHPTAVATSLAGLREHYAPQRLVALFEPRSLTAGREFFFDAYLKAFATADVVRIAPVFHRQRLSDDELLDFPALAAELCSTGIDAKVARDIDQMAIETLGDSRPGDVVVTMSSGSFDGLPAQLAQGLARRP